MIFKNKKIKPISPKGNQPCISIVRTDAEAPILWPPDVKNWFTGKGPEAGKDWGQEEKRVTEDEMVGWHRQLNGHGFEQSPGVSEGQRSLASCSPWGCKESDTAGRLNWTGNTLIMVIIEGRRRRGQQRMRLLDGITDSVDMGLNKLWV